ncbi:hypothetical protein NQ317_011296 [Molorchus minor]|uniref:Ketosynthase family 3 (KS3) domain-containing protein n=1 Tax=Molorchus minor TaxID=1323400 RepID=A0ABQ9JUZ4_9CUCU|nr:hypothetical protein NQ317_011296 [Molorchus minor]
MDQQDISGVNGRPHILGGRILSTQSPDEEVVISVKTESLCCMRFTADPLGAPLDLSLGCTLVTLIFGSELYRGLSGAFPNSKNIHEFRDHLLNKENMVTPNKRWDDFHPEIPKYAGTIPDITKFDSGFFCATPFSYLIWNKTFCVGVHERQSNSLDALARLVLEKTVEAIFDAGLHPSDLEGTKTGVFMAASCSENDRTCFTERLWPQIYTMTGAPRSMIAHRVSYFLKLKGPSYVTDTACSSSLSALEHAFRSIRIGEVDMAIVGGVQLCLLPFVTLQFARLGVLSKTGFSKVFDSSADGYLRSEAVGVIILQKMKNAKRVYARVVHAKSNCDGYKERGITFPSKDDQVELLNEFYEESMVAKDDLSFVEAHGTGTFVGDPEEGKAIDEALAQNRKKPLVIGSVKSNIGHTEPVSGICSIVKCIIAMETGYIPPNLHFEHPHESIRGLVEGRMRVATEKTPFEVDKGLMGVNSFGFGGANCHVLLQTRAKRKMNKGVPSDNLPRLVCLSGRTEEAVNCLCEEISANVLDVEHIRLLHDVFRKDINGHLYRGYIIMSKSGEIARSIQFSLGSEILLPLYIVFGDLMNWQEVGGQLLELPIFAEHLKKFQECISRKGINILKAFKNNKKLVLDEIIMGEPGRSDWNQ